MANKYMKIYSTALSLGKCKLKPQGDTPVHLLKWLWSKRLTVSDVGKDVEKLRPS